MPDPRSPRRVYSALRPGEVPPHEQRPRPVDVGEYQPIPMPEYPSSPEAASPRDVDEVVGPIEWPQQVPARAAEPIQNLLPSKRYPVPTVLDRSPLTALFRSQLVPEPRGNAWRAIGKLLIRLSDHPSQPPAAGSAWVIGPSVLATSAHNLYDFSAGTWSTAVEFAPAYDYYSDDPLPTCRVTSCYLPTAYLSNPTTDRDIAICFVDRNIGDIVDASIPLRAIADVGFFDNYPIDVVGYPAGSHFDFGKQMWQSRGRYLMAQSNGPDRADCPVIASDFGGGASGCPWLVKSRDRYVAVGITSGHAKLRYESSRVNLMTVTSPLLTQALLDELSDEHHLHRFS